MRDILRLHFPAVFWSVNAFILASVAGYYFATSAASSALQQASSKIALLEAAVDVKPALPSPVRAYGILRPDSTGRWSVYVDETHASYGLDAYVEQTSDHLRVFTTGPAPSKAGVIHVTADDGFNVRVQAFANLGLSNATIAIYVDGSLIDPKDIWQRLGTQPGDGNLWVSIFTAD